MNQAPRVHQRNATWRTPQAVDGTDRVMSCPDCTEDTYPARLRTVVSWSIRSAVLCHAQPDNNHAQLRTHAVVAIEVGIRVRHAGPPTVTVLGSLYMSSSLCSSQSMRVRTESASLHCGRVGMRQKQGRPSMSATNTRRSEVGKRPIDRAAAE